jgi:hypothetical protein
MNKAAKKTNAPERIRNCQQLRRAIAEGCNDFCLLLCGGAAFSSKHITTDGRGRFRVFNYIDDSVQTLSGKKLYTETNIGNAMEKGAFVKEKF